MHILSVSGLNNFKFVFQISRLKATLVWSSRDNMAPIIFINFSCSIMIVKNLICTEIKQIITCLRKYVFSFLKKYATVNNSEDNKGFRLAFRMLSLNKRR